VAAARVESTCAAVLLKRLHYALEDGHRILAVIRSTACNSDGRTRTISAPSFDAQMAVHRVALAVARLYLDFDAVRRFRFLMSTATSRRSLRCRPRPRPLNGDRTIEISRSRLSGAAPEPLQIAVAHYCTRCIAGERRFPLRSVTADLVAAASQGHRGRKDKDNGLRKNIGRIGAWRESFVIPICSLKPQRLWRHRQRQHPRVGPRYSPARLQRRDD